MKHAIALPKRVLEVTSTDMSPNSGGSPNLSVFAAARTLSISSTANSQESAAMQQQAGHSIARNPYPRSVFPDELPGMIEKFEGAAAEKKARDYLHYGADIEDVKQWLREDFAPIDQRTAEYLVEEIGD